MGLATKIIDGEDSLMTSYLPFENGHPGFKIALKPLDPSQWIEPDEDLGMRLAEKARLTSDDPEAVFQALPGTETAQREILRLLSAYLVEHYPSLYWKDGPVIHLPTAKVCVEMTSKAPALQTAGQLVDDDLCMMIRQEEGWVLGAASLHFPSHWSLAEKFGKSMATIHKPVPGFSGEMEKRVTRIFDHLQPEQPVWRLNWSLHDDPTLPMPAPTDGPRFANVEGAALLAKAFVRVERQTLRKLPVSGEILFTIKTYIDPLTTLMKNGDPGVVEDLHRALSSMNDDQLAYKGLTDARAKILAALVNDIS